MNFALPFIGDTAGRAVMALLDNVFSLVEPIGYCGYYAQHHNHPYAHPHKRHPFNS